MELGQAENTPDDKSEGKGTSGIGLCGGMKQDSLK